MIRTSGRVLTGKWEHESKDLDSMHSLGMLTQEIPRFFPHGGIYKFEKKIQQVSWRGIKP